MFVKRKLGGGHQQPFSYLPRTWWRPEVCALFWRFFLAVWWWLRWASWALWSVTVRRVEDGRSFCFCFSCHTLGCLSGKRRSNTNFGGLSTYGSSIGDLKWRTVVVWSVGPTPGEGLWWCRCPSAFARSSWAAAELPLCRRSCGLVRARVGLEWFLMPVCGIPETKCTCKQF